MHENADVAPRSTELTPYERQEHEAVSRSLDELPGIVVGALNKIASPVANPMRSVVPDAAIATAIEGPDWMARTSMVDSVPVEPDDLAGCDQSAEAARKWAVACAAEAGGVGGTFGLLGMALDTPAIIVLALRTIRATGTCYGYGGDAASEQGEKEFVLGVLRPAPIRKRRRSPHFCFCGGRKSS